MEDKDIFDNSNNVIFVGLDGAEMPPLPIPTESTTWEGEDTPILDENGNPLPFASYFCHLNAEVINDVPTNIQAIQIQEEKYILRPKNLKYPHKKRKKRILKKWEKRFGYTGGKILYIPKAEIKKELKQINGKFVAQVTINALEMPRYDKGES